MWTLIFGAVQALVGPVFNFLNKRVDADVQKHIVDTNVIGSLGAAGIDAGAKADEFKARIIEAQGKSSPLIWFMGAVLAPLIWHEWQVVMDSSRWVISFDHWYPTIAEHRVGSWAVAALPGAWETTELAIFTSLFIGASTAVTAVAAIKAIKK